MKILSGKETAELLKNMTYLDTQLAEQGVDLTVGGIYQLRGRGKIDFGGSERKDANISKIEPTLRNPDDDYGWWKLESGTYLLEYNETLKTEKLSFIQPLPRLTRNSAFHPVLFARELGLVPLHVGEKGIAIKENSRVSRILVIEE